MNNEQFKERRAALDLTQAALAEELGVSLRAVKHYEAGDRKVPKPVEKLLDTLSK